MTYEEAKKYISRLTLEEKITLNKLLKGMENSTKSQKKVSHNA